MRAAEICLELLKAPGNCKELLGAAGNRWELLGTDWSCWELLEMTRSCWELLEAAGNCWKLLGAAEGNHRSSNSQPQDPRQGILPWGLYKGILTILTLLEPTIQGNYFVMANANIIADGSFSAQG